ncbi:lipid-binding protein [Flavobacterium sp.]|uniref:lipid-binding protein n=1 Tax=Flavobacterium sp. TaxID=239 RepID=UPI002B94456E|nr:lipid-binding protein [Flavobacterium sp.]HSD06446.1 lipid-binding protein [Flavobacterium sp.]
MKILKNNIIKILIGILISVSFASCDAGGDPEAGGTTTENFAGDWWINVNVKSGATVVNKSIKFSTYNTSANDNTMFIDDNGLSQTSTVPVNPISEVLKSKFTINLTDGTFSSDPNTPNLRKASTASTYGTVTITNGKIEKMAGTSKGGHTVDKISFTVEFSNQPGVKYNYTGTKRTGFKEDEY